MAHQRSSINSNQTMSDTTSCNNLGSNSRTCNHKRSWNHKTIQKYDCIEFVSPLTQEKLFVTHFPKLSLPWWTMNRPHLFVFQNVSEEIAVYHSQLTVLRCSSETVAMRPVLSKKHATICFEVHLSRTTFVGFGSASNTNDLFWGPAIVFSHNHNHHFFLFF